MKIPYGVDRAIGCLLHLSISSQRNHQMGGINKLIRFALRRHREKPNRLPGHSALFAERDNVVN